MNKTERRLQCLYAWMKQQNIKQRQDEKNINDPDAFSSDSKLQKAEKPTTASTTV